MQARNKLMRELLDCIYPTTVCPEPMEQLTQEWSLNSKSALILQLLGGSSAANSYQNLQESIQNCLQEALDITGSHFFNKELRSIQLELLSLMVLLIMQDTIQEIRNLRKIQPLIFILEITKSYRQYFTILNQQEPLQIQQILVNFQHKDSNRESIEEDDIMMPSLYGPAIKSNYQLLKGQQLPFILEFNCVPGKEGEGWVDLRIFTSFYKTLQVQFSHTCLKPGNSILGTFEKKVVQVEKFILYDFFLIVIVILLFSVLIFLLKQLCIRRQISCYSCLSKICTFTCEVISHLFSRCFGSKGENNQAHEMNMLSEIKEEDTINENIKNLGFQLEQETPLSRSEN